MNNDDYQKAKEKIERIYRKITGDYISPEAEDIAQEVICMRFSNPKSTNQSYRQSVIDCLRKRTGRKGSSGYQQRRLLVSAELTESIGDIGIDVGEPRNTWNFERFFRGTDRAILLLIIKWGLNEIEIADLFGVSSSWICKRYKRIQSRISERITQESKSARKRESKVEAILREKEKRNWRQLESFKDKAMETGQPW